MTLPLLQTLQNRQVEIIHPDIMRGKIRFALFDFDGTLSTFREGWQVVMHRMMMEYLLRTPKHESEAALSSAVREAIDISTGKQTIYQMITLREMVAARGGEVLKAEDYKSDFNQRLLDAIQHRIDGVGSGDIPREQMLVPGSLALLEQLKQRGVVCFLASGTDEIYVRQEADTLGLCGYFAGIYGAQEDYINHSKRKVIERIIREHHLSGPELVGFGDGFVEIEDVKDAGGIAVGVASDEVRRSGVNEWKRTRLIQAGADVIIPDHLECTMLLQWLFAEE
ncbi:MAG: HAD family hydrolase [Anaerolineae bacterium]|nr:HAD family hydrolase [Anaerolineae bacterium]